MNKLLLTTALLLSGCGQANLEYVKARAEQIFKENGFEVIGYQGFQWTLEIPFTSYGGACVWYTLKKPSNGITYDACLRRWGNEIHLYNLKAYDAIINK